MRWRVAMFVGLVLLLGAPLAGAQVTTQPPVTQPPTTPPPTEPPVTEPPSTAPPPPTTARPRPSTTRPPTTVSTIATTTTLRLLPPPSVVPQDPSVAPVGSKQSDHISSVFVWLSILGFLTGIVLLVGQWFLTRPGRRGWTF